ncbi:hypothetical protein EJ06DRAFT_531663, partial [Trichodelitschia bisporula]
KCSQCPKTHTRPWNARDHEATQKGAAVGSNGKGSGGDSSGNDHDMSNNSSGQNSGSSDAEHKAPDSTGGEAYT